LLKKWSGRGLNFWTAVRLLGHMILPVFRSQGSDYELWAYSPEWERKLWHKTSEMLTLDDL
jgi:hypothetical protein